MIKNKKIIAISLASIIAAQNTALAETTHEVYIAVDRGDTTEEIHEQDLTEDKEIELEGLSDTNGEESSVNVRHVVTEDPDDTDAGTKLDITINGDVEAHGELDSTWDKATALQSDGYGAGVGNTKIDVNGSVSATEDTSSDTTAVGIKADTTDIHVTGDVNASADESTAISDLDNSQVNVDGNVSSSGSYAYGADGMNNSSLSIGGNVTVEGDSYAVFANNIDQESTISVGGGVNVSSSNGQASLTDYVEGSSINIDGNVQVDGHDYSYITEGMEGGSIHIGGDASIRSTNGTASIVSDELEDSSLTIDGNASVTSVNDDAFGISEMESSGEVTIGGKLEVSSDNGNAYGMYEAGQGKITLGGLDVTAGNNAKAFDTIYESNTPDAGVTINGDVNVSGGQEASFADEISESSVTITGDVSLNAPIVNKTGLEDSSLSIGGDLNVTGDTEGILEGLRSDLNIGGNVTVSNQTNSSLSDKTLIRINHEGEDHAVNIGGKISVSATQQEGDEDIGFYITGIDTNTAGTYDFESNGIISANTNISAKGINISNEANGDEGRTYGIETDSSYFGETTINIGEDGITINNTGNATYGSGATGIKAYNTDASTSINVNGDINVTSENSSAIGLDIVNNYTMEESNVVAKITGDILGSTAGIKYSNTDQGSTGSYHGDITVDGTVKSGSAAAILVSGYVADNNLSVTAWKIEQNDAGNIIERDNGTTYDATTRTQVTSSEADEITRDFEEQVNYIIKFEQPTEGGTLSLDNTRQVNGYDTAHEGETVYLMIQADEGYEINGAYNGKGEKVSLLQDTDGNYYVNVPKGGGVYLSTSLSKIVIEQDDEPTDNTPTDNTQGGGNNGDGNNNNDTHDDTNTNKDNTNKGNTNNGNGNGNGNKKPASITVKPVNELPENIVNNNEDSQPHNVEHESSRSSSNDSSNVTTNDYASYDVPVYSDSTVHEVDGGLFKQTSANEKYYVVNYDYLKNGWYKINDTGSNDTKNSAWYKFDDKGKVITGWIMSDDDHTKWYYASEANDDNMGQLEYGFIMSPSDGQTYYMDSNTGVMLQGYQMIDGNTYYFHPLEMTVAAHWYYDGENWLYIPESRGTKSYGQMYRNEFTPDGRYADANGIIH